MTSPEDEIRKGNKVHKEALENLRPLLDHANALSKGDPGVTLHTLGLGLLVMLSNVEDERVREDYVNSWLSAYSDPKVKASYSALHKSPKKNK